MTVTSSVQNSSSNKSDPSTNSNSPIPPMTNTHTPTKAKTSHSKSYKNPKKSSTNINASSSINNLNNNHKNKSNNLQKIIMLDSSQCTHQNNLYIKSITTNHSPNTKIYNTSQALSSIIMSSSQTKKLTPVTSQILSKISTKFNQIKNYLKINSPQRRPQYLTHSSKAGIYLLPSKCLIVNMIWLWKWIRILLEIHNGSFSLYLTQNNQKSTLSM